MPVVASNRCGGPAILRRRLRVVVGGVRFCLGGACRLRGLGLPFLDPKDCENCA